MLISARAMMLSWLAISAQSFSIQSTMENFGKTIQRRLDDIQVEGLRDLDRLQEMIGSIGRQFQPAQDRIGRVADAFDLSDFTDLYDPLSGHQDLAVADGGPGLMGTLNRLVGTLEKINPLQGIMDLFAGNWWEEENVCTETRQYFEDEDRQFHFTIKISDVGSDNYYEKEESCDEVWPVRQCKTRLTESGKTSVEVKTWSCCHGAVRSEEQGGACVKVPTETVEQTVRDLGGLEFLALLEEENLLSRLEGPVTVLLPTEKALENFGDIEARLNGLESDLHYNVQQDLFSYRRRKRDSEGFMVVETNAQPVDMRNILLAHFLTGAVRSDQLYHGQVLTAGGGLKDDSVSGSVRVTVYHSASGQRVVMANCARLVTPDTMASDGIVHLVDRVVVPAVDTIANILEADSQFRTFVGAVKQDKELWRKLSSSSPQQLTVFAPTESAFKKLDTDLRNRITSGDTCAQDVLRGHVIPSLLCSSIVEGKSKTRNLMEDYMRFDKNGTLLNVNGINVVFSDIMATNGVVHVIDDVIVPDSAETDDTFLDVIQDQSPFMANAIEQADMVKELRMMSDITLLLPSLEAVSKLPVNYTTELLADKDRLREFLSYHILTERTDFDRLASDDSFLTKLTDQKIRVNRYNSILSSERITAQCSQVHPATAKICGGKIFTVDQILLPPQGSLLDLLKMLPEFSRFLELVESAEMEEELEVDSRTLLAPPNSAFDSIDEQLFLEIQGNKNHSVQIVSRHILDSVECCAGIQLKNTVLGTDKVDSLEGSISLRKTAGGHLSANNGQIFKCDVMGSNGVLHYVDKLFLEKPKTSISRLSSILNIFKNL